MSTYHWEYCALVSHADAGAEDRPGWRCRVSFFTPEGMVTRPLHDPEQPGRDDVFERTLAELGMGGWELISLQHELVPAAERPGGDGHLTFSAFGVAYLKRPVEPGRPIHEPVIALRLER
jgi:hypothetical protein